MKLQNSDAVLAAIEPELALEIGRDAIMAAVTGHWIGDRDDAADELERLASAQLAARRPASALGLVWRLSRVWARLIDDLGGYEKAKGYPSFVELEGALRDVTALAGQQIERMAAKGGV